MEPRNKEEEKSPDSEGSQPSWSQLQKKLDVLVEPYLLEYLTNPRFTENCAFRGVNTFIGGGLMGFAMGAFFSSMGPTMSGLPDPSEVKGGWKQQTKEHFKHIGRSGVSMMKTFAVVGALYSTTECIVEKHRAKNDLMNPLIAGCISGGILASRAGVGATVMGCGGFAAFSVGIDWLMAGHH